MVRRLSWELRAQELRDRLANSDSEGDGWSRDEIMAFFAVGKGPAIRIMRAAGTDHVNWLGSSYLVDRDSLLAMLDRILQKQSPRAEFHRNHADFQEPRRRKIRLELGNSLRTMRVSDLPPGVILEIGSLEFRGLDSGDIFKSLEAFLLVCETDEDEIVSYLDPPAETAARDGSQDQASELRVLRPTNPSRLVQNSVSVPGAPLSWEERLHELRKRLGETNRNLWDRQSIEDFFSVERGSAKRIMRAAGMDHVHKVGCSYFVRRDDLCALIDRLHKEQSPRAQFHRDLMAFREPRRRKIRSRLGKNVPALPVAQLSPAITLETGLLGIRGRDSDEVLMNLEVFIQTLEIDRANVTRRLDGPSSAPVPNRELEDDEEEVKALLRRNEILEMQEDPPASLLPGPESC